MGRQRGRTLQRAPDRPEDATASVRAGDIAACSVAVCSMGAESARAQQLVRAWWRTGAHWVGAQSSLVELRAYRFAGEFASRQTANEKQTKARGLPKVEQRASREGQDRAHTHHATQSTKTRIMHSCSRQ